MYVVHAACRLALCPPCGGWNSYTALRPAARLELGWQEQSQLWQQYQLCPQCRLLFSQFLIQSDAICVWTCAYLGGTSVGWFELLCLLYSLFFYSSFWLSSFLSYFDLNLYSLFSALMWFRCNDRVKRKARAFSTKCLQGGISEKIWQNNFPQVLLFFPWVL